MCSTRSTRTLSLISEARHNLAIGQLDVATRLMDRARDEVAVVGHVVVDGETISSRYYALKREFTFRKQSVPYKVSYFREVS